MKIINTTPVFNPNNDSFVYLSQTDDGAFWVRSSAGKWAKIDPPQDTESVDRDFSDFLGLGAPATLAEIKVDNNADVVVPVDDVTP